MKPADAPNRQPVPVRDIGESKRLGIYLPYPAFDTRTNLEALRWVLQYDVRIMIWPNYTIDISRYRNKEARICEFLDGTFNEFANLDIP